MTQRLDIFHVSEKGARKTMEDTLTIEELPSGQLFIGIYDGHGGSAAAEYARENLHLFFEKTLSEVDDEGEAFYIAYEKTASSLREELSGTTALTFTIRGKRLCCGNVGDAELIVVGGREIRTISTLHRLDNREEHERLEANGATILPPYVYSGLTCLMPTRTLGDAHFKSVGVISEPTVTCTDLETSDLWIVAGSDGLFDFINKEEIGSLLREERNAAEAASKLRRVVLQERGGTDNLTFVLVRPPRR